MLERVLLELVVGFEDSPNRKNMSTAEIESTRLIESPSICFLVTELAGIESLDSTQLGNEIAIYSQNPKGEQKQRRSRDESGRTVFAIGSL